MSPWFNMYMNAPGCLYISILFHPVILSCCDIQLAIYKSFLAACLYCKARLYMKYKIIIMLINHGCALAHQHVCLCFLFILFNKKRKPIKEDLCLRITISIVCLNKIQTITWFLCDFLLLCVQSYNYSLNCFNMTEASLSVCSVWIIWSFSVSSADCLLSNVGLWLMICA